MADTIYDLVDASGATLQRYHGAEHEGSARLNGQLRANRLRKPLFLQVEGRELARLDPETTFEARSLSGRLRNGFARDAGKRWHAVAPTDARAWGRALCGAEPGRNSGVGWGSDVGAEVTCPRCAARLQRLQAQGASLAAELFLALVNSKRATGQK